VIEVIAGRVDKQKLLEKLASEIDGLTGGSRSSPRGGPLTVSFSAS